MNKTYTLFSLTDQFKKQNKKKLNAIDITLATVVSVSCLHCCVLKFLSA